MMKDFTVEKYTQLCGAIIKAGYTSMTVLELINQQNDLNIGGKRVILRHDVDRYEHHALELAKIEKDRELRGSYYFRIPSTWNPSLIEEIASLGHEVSLHYECVDRAKGSMERAAQIMRDDLKLFATVAQPQTVSMHGNPATKWDNRVLWEHYTLQEFDLVGEVYQSVDFTKVMYYSDTGRTWQDEKFNIKDVIPNNKARLESKPSIKTTDDFIALIKNEDRNLYILIHPERWALTPLGWWIGATRDVAINYLKVAFKSVRRVLS